MPDPHASPFADIRALAASLPGPDLAAADAVRERLGRSGPGGRVGRLAAWAAGWQGRAAPGSDRGLVCAFASTHGVIARIDPGADAATRARLGAFASGSTATNLACAATGLGFKAFDLALDYPTGDIAHEPAMSERDCVATMAFGMEAIAGGADVLAISCTSAGAHVPAAATLCALSGDPPAYWLAGGRRELDAATEAVLRHGRAAPDPLGVLASLGGRDLAAIAGAILAARSERMPVLLDGFAAAAAAAVLHAIEPGLVGHCLAAGAPGDPAHGRLLARLGLDPVLPGLDLPDGDGLGGALALGLLKTVLACAREPAARPAAAG